MELLTWILSTFMNIMYISKLSSNKSKPIYISIAYESASFSRTLSIWGIFTFAQLMGENRKVYWRKNPKNLELQFHVINSPVPRRSHFVKLSHLDYSDDHNRLLSFSQTCQVRDELGTSPSSCTQDSSPPTHACLP